MKKIILIGGGGHCKSVIDVIETEGKFIIEGIIDKIENSGKKIFNYEIIGTDDHLFDLCSQGYYFLITIGQIKTSQIRANLFNKIKEMGGKFPIVQSPLAYVSKHASLGEGTVIHHSAIINAGANIGDNCIINSGSLIEHDAIIGNHCHISTGVIINGGVSVKSDTFVGSGSIFLQNKSIGENSIVGAGSLIVKNGEPGDIFLGNPASKKTS